jgi:hypothetical protein
MLASILEDYMFKFKALSVRRRLAACSMLFILSSAFPFHEQAFAQNIPVERAHPLEGDWVNVLGPNSGGMSRIIIQGLTLHPYGACHPEACDWGTIPAKSFANSVRDSTIVSLTATHLTNFNEVLITATLLEDGRLRVETFTTFTDKSIRSNYRKLEFFARQP